MENSASTEGGGWYLLMMAVGYFLPFIIATIRRQPNNTAIFLINAFAGWTVIGWFIALIWAVKAIEKPTVVYVERPAAEAGKDKG